MEILRRKVYNMAKKRKKLTEEERIIRFLKEQGFTEVTDVERKQPWYQEHLKQLERWRKEEAGKPFSVREKQYLYGSTPKRKSRSKV